MPRKSCTQITLIPRDIDFIVARKQLEATGRAHDLCTYLCKSAELRYYLLILYQVNRNIVYILYIANRIKEAITLQYC